jgi:hypothetical protein
VASRPGAKVDASPSLPVPFTASRNKASAPSSAPRNWGCNGGRSCGQIPVTSGRPELPRLGPK